MTDEQVKLVEDNLDMAYKVAYKWIRDYSGRKWDVEDFKSAAHEGLVKAAQTYNPEKGYQFNTYAGTCIQNEIRMLLRKDHHAVTAYLDDIVMEGQDITLSDIMLTEDSFELELTFSNSLKEFLENLSKRDRQILFLFAKTHNQSEVSRKIGLSQSVISRHIKRLYSKFKKEVS